MKKQATINKNTYFLVCGIVGQYNEFRRKLISEYDRATCLDVEKINQSALALSVDAVEHGIHNTQTILESHHYEPQLANKIVRAFVSNCEGKTFVYLQHKLDLPMSRQSFTYFKGFFIRDIAERMGYIGNIVK